MKQNNFKELSLHLIRIICIYIRTYVFIIYASSLTTADYLLCSIPIRNLIGQFGANTIKYYAFIFRPDSYMNKVYIRGSQ